jgi:hypothetical protein
MHRRLLALIIFVVPIFVAGNARAQGMTFGFNVGGSESLEDGIDLNLGDSVREVFLGTELESGTVFRIKLGQADVDETGRVEYIQALVDYETDQVFGSTSLFAGPAFYRRQPEDQLLDEETEFGFAVGVSGTFPINRSLAFLAELSYHWANFEEPQRLLMATGGFKIRF